MSDVVIRADGLGKKYLIGHETVRERYVALRDVLASSAKSFARSVMDVARGRQLISGDEVEEFWALKDLSFQISRGDVVGVIGRNGAGKSTLLKILSRITEPSDGRVEIRGRVASLLEVGTGFHPELSGRENIYLNGAILGMARTEIKRKFDEIVAFADVEAFIDTPVKRYSSGMYVRLAFAVAAHLEPDILIVDEVLSVGDAQFQKRSLGKMQEVRSSGRTVIFVSHNLPLIRGLCTKTLYLDKGRRVFYGDTSEAINCYQAAEPTNANFGDRAAGVLFSRDASADASNTVQIAAVRLLSADLAPIGAVYTWSDFTIRILYETERLIKVASAELHILAPDGSELINVASYRNRNDPITLHHKGGYIDFQFSKFPLSSGGFSGRVGLRHSSGEWLCVEDFHLIVEPRDVYGSGFPPAKEQRFVAPEVVISSFEMPEKVMA